jgi:hypothetical protein
LIRQDLHARLDTGNILKHRILHYDYYTWHHHGDRSFAHDLSSLSHPRSGFAGLTKCTLMGRHRPNAWLEVDDIRKIGLLLPSLQELTLMRCKFKGAYIGCPTAAWPRDQRIHLILQDVRIPTKCLRVFRQDSSLLSVRTSGYGGSFLCPRRWNAVSTDHQS